MSANAINIESMFKYLLFAYSFTLLSFLFWLQGGCLTSKLETQVKDTYLRIAYDNNSEFENSSGIEYIYRNVTSIVYIDKTVEKIVYVDKTDIPQYGPGENGTGVKPVEYDKDKMDIKELEKRKKFHGFDTIMSDSISLHRQLPDMRHPACKSIHYPTDMPPVSVVIIFRDEWHSILLRTAYSVLQMSPPHLLNEIILVDDGSTNPDLVAEVDLHVANVEKFKLVRNKKPLGLMMARQKGIDATMSDYFIVMDGHMEVGPGWLEPLVYRLVDEPNALLCSHIGTIRHEDFAYFIDDDKYSMFDNQFPFFDFLTLDQMWASFSPEFRSVRNKSIEPIPYGTVQGMMGAMRKAFFYQLGGFDPGMKVWGTEQMELSIKVWCCGGRVEMVPCSKMVHMYRQTPWTRSQFTAVQYANKARTLEVWLDSPYKEYVYLILKESNFTMGDITDRLRIRTENNCKPYKHFMDTVKQFSDVYLPVTPLQKGSVMNILYRVCFDIAQLNKTDKLILFGCHGKRNQFFLLTEFNEIRFTRGRILKAVKSQKTNSSNIEIQTSPSTKQSNDFKWKFENGFIFHMGTGLCIEATNSSVVEMRPCSDNKGSSQSWVWGDSVWTAS